MEFLVGNELCIGTWQGRVYGIRTKAASQQVAYYLGALGYEQAFALAVFLLFQRTDELDLIFRQHIFYFLCAKIQVFRDY